MCCLVDPPAWPGRQHQHIVIVSLVVCLLLLLLLLIGSVCMLCCCNVVYLCWTPKASICQQNTLGTYRPNGYLAQMGTWPSRERNIHVRTARFERVLNLLAGKKN